MSVRSHLDPSVRRLLRAHRRVAESERIDQKLGLLRRLERQKVIRDLPETRVEQSFNEQLFARVLNYRTLFSHDGGEFHLLPKNLTGPKRFDDFSLGFFGAGQVVFGTAEFKSPGVDLDAPQPFSGYAGRTPVEQAFTAISGLSSCRWVLVSNFRELRLYSVPGGALLAVADLHEIRSADDLADLLAHFDRTALLPPSPEKGRPGMSDALDADFVGAPVPSVPDAFRIVARFTPACQVDATPLHALERSLRRALETSHYCRLFFGGDQYEAPRAPLRLRDGWAYAEGSPHVGPPAIRVAASRLGQVVVSARCPYERGFVQGYRRVNVYKVKQVLALFVRVVIHVLGFEGIDGVAGMGTDGVEGGVGLDLRDVRNAEIWNPEPVSHGSDTFNVGSNDQPDLFAGDFQCQVPRGIGRATATCLCDLAVQFREGDTCGVLLDEDALCADLTKNAARSLSGAK